VKRFVSFLVATALLAAPAACTFPDVDYAAGGAGTITGSGGAATGDAGCGALTSCTGAATSCAGGAQMTHTACLDQCNGIQSCANNCDKALSISLTDCFMTCATCAGSCAQAHAACKSAAGI
jgi:hypothetical protein